MHRFVPRLVGTLVAAAILAAATLTPALAQAQYTEVKLKAFVAAAVAVNRKIAEWGPKIETAPNEAEANRLAQQANGELKGAVVKTDGITLDEYNQIARSARTNETLAKRIQALHQKNLKK